MVQFDERVVIEQTLVVNRELPLFFLYQGVIAPVTGCGGRRMTLFGFDEGGLYALSLALLVSTLVLAVLVCLAPRAGWWG